VKEHKFHRGVIYEGDVLEVLKTLESGSVNTIITSPPYWGLRDYQAEGQIGLESSLEEYLDRLLNVAAELKRVLRDDGVMFWNHGDSYGGSNGVGYKQTIEEKNRAIGGREGNVSVKKTRGIKEAVPAKSMAMQNYRLAMRMVDEQGWILRNILVWHKINHLPSSVKDRFTNSYEPVFFFVKNQKYWSDLDAVRVPHKNAKEWKYGQGLREGKNTIGGRRKTKDESYKVNGMRNPTEPNEAGAFHLLGKNPGDVWSLTMEPFPEAHFAVFPTKLIDPMVKFGCPPNGIVLDPFMGSGTTALVAAQHGCNFIGIELNPEYIEIAKQRIGNVANTKSLEEFV